MKGERYITKLYLAKSYAKVAASIEGVDPLENTRKRENVLLRQVLMVLFCEYTRFSLADIGRVFGRDHSTVCHAKKCWEDSKDKKDRWSLLMIEFYNTHDKGIREFIANNKPLSEDASKVKILQSENSGLIKNMGKLERDLLKEGAQTGKYKRRAYRFKTERDKYKEMYERLKLDYDKYVSIDDVSEIERMKGVARKELNPTYNRSTQKTGI